MSVTSPDLFQTYARQLRAHAHRLIAEGYSRMDKAAFAREQEPAITGELVRQMREYLESDNGAPAWVCFYSIHDDPPLSIDGKLGKARPRVDIEFERVSHGQRPRLRFEAKRLNSATGHTVSVYLGREGLGCFLSGRYPMTHRESGMLGYVQSEDEAAWAERVAAALRHNGPQYGVVAPPFAPQCVCVALPHTFVSHHVMKEVSLPVMIHHVFLRFVGE